MMTPKIKKGLFLAATLTLVGCQQESKEPVEVPEVKVNEKVEENDVVEKEVEEEKINKPAQNTEKDDSSLEENDTNEQDEPSEENKV